ncbi:class D sortase [Clostridium sp. YIM B02505]|uniref:Class D sortase n=1 Tax=Clostridium yunnanense TaxID=2800325 RepID=A0ABS1ESX5_9CLOT|nr:class D sortase [Clostridium yunnanense]MBK1812429.1 class D sortase [Clostridium yunnanense]
MKKKIINIVAVILIVSGITMIGATIFMKYTAHKKQAELRASFEKMDDAGKVNPGVDASKSTVKDSNSDNKNEQSNVKPIALLIIPKIDINVVVGEGTDDDLLRYAVGHFKNTALPGEKGNLCLAGHRNFTYAEYFKDLNKLEKNDEIIVKTKDKEFTYLVTTSFIVNPDEVDVLSPTKDETITLVTCTIGAKQRLIVKGSLKK